MFIFFFSCKIFRPSGPGQMLALTVKIYDKPYKKEVEFVPYIQILSKAEKVKVKGTI